MNFNLYIKNDVRFVFALPANLADFIVEKKAPVQLIGTFSTELTKGLFPIGNINPSMGFHTLKDEGEIKQMDKILEQTCDLHTRDSLMDSYIQSLKFIGSIHVLKYIGKENPTGDIIQEGPCRSFYHGNKADFSIKEQLFVADESKGTSSKGISKLSEPYQGNENFDVVIDGGSEHCYRIRNSTNDEYKILNHAGTITTSKSVASKLLSLKILETHELSDFLQ